MENITHYHVSASVRAFVEMGKKQFMKVYGDSAFLSDDGKHMTSADAYDALVQELAQGHEVIMSAGCDNFDWKTGCKGHTS